jgi:hypothetical protein
MPRPLTVTVVAWLAIVWSLFTALPKLLLLVDPEARAATFELVGALSRNGPLTVPEGFQIAHAVAGSAVLMVAGTFMLRGHFWAMVTLLVWVAGALALTFAVTGLSPSLYLKLATAALIGFVLTRPAALDYFHRHESPGNRPAWRGDSE